MQQAPISGTTGLYALLGSPVAHSMSPAIHNASFAHLGIDAAYLAFDVPEEETAAAVSAVRALGIRGFNLTMPCKTAVLECLDSLSPAARLMGAVNTVKVEADGTLSGHNTDGAGMMRALGEAGAVVAGADVLVLGAGGAARAIVAQAGLDAAASVRVAKRPGRTWDAAAEAVARLAEGTQTAMSLVDFADAQAMREAVGSASIVINATPIGMGESSKDSPVDAGWLAPGQFVADAVYHPRRTRLLADAEAAGATPVEGIGMLLWQGLIAEEIWLAQELAERGLRVDPGAVLPMLG